MTRLIFLPPACTPARALPSKVISYALSPINYVLGVEEQPKDGSAAARRFVNKFEAEVGRAGQQATSPQDRQFLLYIFTTYVHVRFGLVFSFYVCSVHPQNMVVSIVEVFRMHMTCHRTGPPRPRCLELASCRVADTGTHLIEQVRDSPHSKYGT